MHEMPFTQAIVEMAVKEAAGRPIRAIYLRVGALSAIVPGSMEVFFDYLKKGTLAEGASLVFETVPITLTCQQCHEVLELPCGPKVNPRQVLAAAFKAGCPCGKGELKLTGGLSLDMTGIDV